MSSTASSIQQLEHALTDDFNHRPDGLLSNARLAIPKSRRHSTA